MIKLKILDEKYAVSHFPGHSPLIRPEGSELFSVTYTKDEISVVCEEKFVLGDVAVERGWSALLIEGILDFSLIGIIAGISGILAEEKISLFVISTYNTDYILIKENELERAVAKLKERGYLF